MGWSNESVPLKRRKNVRWIWLGLAVAVLILLGIAGALPGVMIFAGIIALILGIVALLANGIKWARIPNRKFGAGVAGAALVLTIAGTALSGTEGTAGPEALLEEPAVAETLQADLASFIGKSCEFDYQVMTQGDDNNYCDEDSAGALIWVDQDTHDRAEADLAVAREAETQKKLDEAAAAEAKEAAEAADAKKAAAAEAAKTKEDAAVKKAKAAAAAKVKEAADAKKAKAAATAKAKKAAEAKAALAAEKTRKKKNAETEVRKSPSSTYYQNCTAVRNAGAAPIHRGEPGYSRKLDRDGDGVACE
ncbi:excalibur calcium-binding domain-containing protein [Paeniglutamicibacter psychrophenolicus]|uniref:excalibur calcium-binding domain-containing protein n=1 Tax=Paeniglutamicibacter psychrophenolicus TaxID=257454 RepID=UPI0027D8D8EF|nr:excalibur calcium-binding domain-containing protein [Paeniglutamicibacter psychrophenolicus]